MNTPLEDRIRRSVEALPVPTPDVDMVVAAGRRVRRRTTGAALAAAALTGVVVTGVALVTGPGEQADGGQYASTGSLDASAGLRAYAAPGAEIHVGGRSLPAEGMEHLDTEATATPQGVVFFDDNHRPLLLDLSGDVVELGDAPPEAPEGWRPSAKADSTAPRVALTQPTTTGVEVRVVDLVRRETVAARNVRCSGGTCGQVGVEALDAGVAWVRTPEGIRRWDGEDTWELVSGSESRIADVRGSVVLYDESRPPPHPPAPWRGVGAPIDARLTFDGRYVLDWSSRLESTLPGAAPLVLEVGPGGKEADPGPAWWAVDTDGSILVAVRPDGRVPLSTVYDCAVPSGDCEELGPLSTEHGDPMFLSADM